MNVTIAWLWPDGAGGAKLPDGVARVPGTVPGDRVELGVGTRRGRVLTAPHRQVAASPDRRVPSCPVVASCGGCDLAHLQLAARHRALADAVQRATRAPAPPAVSASPRSTGHRARIKLAIDGARVGYRAARAQTLVEISTCAVARPELQPALDAVRAWLADPAVDERLPRAVELRTDGERVAIDLHGALPAVLPAWPHIGHGGRTVRGDATLHFGTAGESLRCSPGAFFQVNLEVNEALTQHVATCVAQVGPERVLDLYAGIGNLSVPIARATGVEVVAVEIAGSAARDLAHNAARSGLPVKALAVDAARFDPTREPFDVAVLDPPRSGATGVLGRLGRQRPRRIVVVSCNLAATVRDLRELEGYELSAVHAFDMFPDTHHLEVVLCLDRRTRQRVRRR